MDMKWAWFLHYCTLNGMIQPASWHDSTCWQNFCNSAVDRLRFFFSLHRDQTYFLIKGEKLTFVSLGFQHCIDGVEISVHPNFNLTKLKLYWKIRALEIVGQSTGEKDLLKGAVVVRPDMVAMVTLEAGRKRGTARKRAGQSQIRLTTTHFHTATPPPAMEDKGASHGCARGVHPAEELGDDLPAAALSGSLARYSPWWCSQHPPHGGARRRPSRGGARRQPCPLLPMVVVAVGWGKDKVVQD
jgi:hypothetical protein